MFIWDLKPCDRQHLNVSTRHSYLRKLNREPVWNNFFVSGYVAMFLPIKWLCQNHVHVYSAQRHNVYRQYTLQNKLFALFHISTCNFLPRVWPSTTKLIHLSTKMACPRHRLYLEILVFPWWRHEMETFSPLLAICAGNSPPVNSPHKGQWRFFDLRLDGRLSKHSWGWWLETPSCPLWRQSNAYKWCFV